MTRATVSIASNRFIGARIVQHAARTVAPARAAILSFPNERRRGFIMKIAVAMKRKRSDQAAEVYLAGELRRCTREMRDRGIPQALIRREIHAIEPAVRGELWRLLFGPLSGTGKRS